MLNEFKKKLRINGLPLVKSPEFEKKKRSLALDVVSCLSQIVRQLDHPILLYSRVRSDKLFVGG